MSLLVVSNTLDSEDLVVLLLALDQLDRYAIDELAKQGASQVQQAAIANLRSRILVMRGKLRVMREAL